MPLIDVSQPRPVCRHRRRGYGDLIRRRAGSKREDGQLWPLQGFSSESRRTPTRCRPCVTLPPAFAAAYCDHETQLEVALAVTEACSNVVRHAYPDGHGEITLAARLDGAHLIFVITDHGTGPTGSSRDKGLGMGLMLMQRLADMRITSNGRGTRVELRFPRRLPP